MTAHLVDVSSAARIRRSSRMRGPARKICVARPRGSSSRKARSSFAGSRRVAGSACDHFSSIDVGWMRSPTCSRPCGMASRRSWRAQSVMDEIVGFHIHRGVLALGERAADRVDVLSASRLVVGAVSVTNHDNVGGIFRNAAAFGTDAVVLDEATCDPLYRKSIRVSVGGALVVPFARVANAEAMLDALEAAGFPVYALRPRGEETPTFSREKDLAARAPRRHRRRWASRIRAPARATRSNRDERIARLAQRGRRHGHRAARSDALGCAAFAPFPETLTRRSDGAPGSRACSSRRASRAPVGSFSRTRA